MLTVHSNHQVVSHLSQLSNTLSVNTTQALHGLRKFCSKKIDSSRHKEDVICSDSFDEAVKNHNNYVTNHFSNIYKAPESSHVFAWVKNLPDINELKKLISSNKTFHLREKFKAPWQISYVSTDSFDENKRLGFNRVPRNLKSNSMFFLTATSLPHQLLELPSLSNIQAHQKRGFKTQRAVVKEKESNADLLSRVANLFRAKPETKPTGVEKLTDEKMSVDAVAAALTKVYGEGYNAGKSANKLRKLRWFVLGTLFVAIVIGGRLVTSKVRFSISDPVQKARPEDINVTFADVRGSEEVKKELSTVVSFLKNPKKFFAVGARLPKGVLLVGEPGVGKTLLAKAVAGEAGVPFFYASGSEFDEILVGEGARRIRQLFNVAKENAPCVIFLDEIDSVGGVRTKSSIHPYANQTINQLLAEMDGFTPNEGVIVLAATNRASDLDKALVRPGRFDMSIEVPLPRISDRRDIIHYYLKKIACRNIDIEALASMTPGWNGATLENMINWAAILAATENSNYVYMHHVMSAYDRIILGVSWGSSGANQIQERLRRTAYHEAGHTLVAMLTPGHNPVNKVTIEARGKSLGHTSFLVDDEGEDTKAALIARLDSCFGGQVAEEIMFGTEEVSAGCMSDLQSATDIAKTMVKKFGMGVTNRYVKDGESLCAESQTALDKDIERLLSESKERAKSVINNHAEDLHKIAGALLKHQTLTNAELKSLLGTADKEKSPSDQ